MIAATRGLSQDRILRTAQIVMMFLASIVVVAFMRFHLLTAAKTFRQDFERQSFVELSRGETFLLARKLAALGKSEQFSCISAKKSGILFFEETNGSCDSGFFRSREIVVEPNHELEIAFTMQLSGELYLGLLLFLTAQGALAAIVVLSQRRLNFLQYESELALAALAQQVAHDIQAPLSVMASMTGEIAGSEQSRLHARALQRLKRLVGHLQGKDDQTEISGALASLLSTCIQEKKIEIGKNRDSEFRLVWESALGNRVLAGSEFEWRRVLSNLLNNALEASAAGTAITISVSEAGSGKVRIAITDQGKGMSAATLSRLGARGFSEGKNEGKGLGFFLTKKYVSSIGGAVEVESAAGRGTTVSLKVPATEPQSIILVDDSADLAKAWQLAGARRGISLQYYSSPDELIAAKDAIPKQTLIYLDLDFPDAKLDALSAGEILFKEGFQHISIATGRPKAQVSRPSWAKAVVGKDPPWL